MEMSSPLAAMHPPPLPAPWGLRRDLPSSKNPFGAHHPFGPKSFNFRDLSMKKSNTDYFNLQPLRGSSPTASLAADMSSNLHVDRAPSSQLLAAPSSPPTPLCPWTTEVGGLLLHRQLAVADNGSSSRNHDPSSPLGRRHDAANSLVVPSFVPDTMDCSPLPHKQPYTSFRCVERPLTSPTPETTPASSADDEMLSPMDLPPVPQLTAPPRIEEPRPAKKVVIPPAPSLARTKNFSTNTVSLKSRENLPCPPFKFGAGASSLSTSSSTTSLDECFAASPPQERNLFSSHMVAYSKPKSFALSSNLSRASGSPLSGNIRKPAGPPAKRPTKFRRSLSMFEHPGDVMNQQEDSDAYTPSGLQSVMDIDDTPSLKLPHFTPPNEPDSLPRISDETLIDVLNGNYRHLYDEQVIIDCRFEYEYEGGHIEGAINHCDKELLGEKLFPSAPTTGKTLLIFHCEYSAHRAPLMAKFVRQEDRKVNAFRYPQLTYPEVYILDGGYSGFYSAHRTRCFPQNYLRMDAKEHEQSCERGLNKLRQRSKLSRAHTFAIGQHSCQVEDSPTAAGRSRSGNVLTLGGDDSLDLTRFSFGRRNASY